jgi:hypothetical protein
MALTVHRRFARTVILAIIRMLAHRTVIGGPVTSRTECSLELARGTDGDSDAVGAVAASVIATDLVADFAMVAGLVVAGSRVGRDLGIGAASPIAAADSVVAADSTAAVVAFMAAVVDSMAAVDSTEVAVGSMAAVVADSTVAVVADSTVAVAGTAAATGKLI